MAESLEDRIRGYRQTASTRQSQKARAEAEVEAAERREAEARAALKSDFGVETPEDARKLRDEAQAEIDGLKAEIETALAEAGA